MHSPQDLYVDDENINLMLFEAMNEGVIRKCFKKPFNIHEIASEIDQVLEEG